MIVKSQISYDVGIPVHLLEDVLVAPSSHTKRILIPKKTGGQRLIYQPSRKLKTIQYWLIANLFCKMSIHRSAQAYRPGVSILDNAKQHRANRYFLKIDLYNFFPSIQWADLDVVLDNQCSNSDVSEAYKQDLEDIIRAVCFLKDGTLPVGFPTSPVISNLVMYSFDCVIEALFNDNSKYGKVVYTRYADDIILSTNKKGVSHLLLNEISKAVATTVSPRIKINEKKTRTGSSSGGSAFVTGLRVCSGGHITIQRKQKDYIRLLLSLYKKRELVHDDYDKLRGHLAYVSHVAPRFYSKLQEKYFQEISELNKK